MSAAALERQVGSTVAGKYRLLRVLGRGGMGVVYEAEHAMTRRRVAVKVLHAHHRQGSDAAKRFINEAQAAGRISHPNVVEVLDAGEDSDGSLYLVLELLTGHDLASVLMRQRRLEVAETITIMAQVLQALEIAHRQGIIHRDIKPENIFLTRGVTGDTHVKLLDFGISKAIGGSDGVALNVTQTNTTVGTPHYMSPEQARGERTIDQRADLWAVGVVMYECLAGRVPFDGDTYNDQIVKVITEPHGPVSQYDVPAELSRIVDKTLEKDRTRRYGRAAEVIADLRHFIEKHPEYSSVSAHLLREPQAPPPDEAPVPAARPDAATMDTAHDPAGSIRPLPLVSAAPGGPKPAPLASLLDTASEDAPTTIRGAVSAPDEGARARSDVTSPLPAIAHVPVTPARGRAMLVVGVVLLAVGLGAVAALVTRNVGTRDQGPSASAAAMVTVRFSGVPAGGRIIVGGVPMYTNDQSVLPRSASAVRVDVVAPGYEPLHFALVPDRDQTVPVMMRPASAVAPSVLPTAVAPVPVPSAFIVPSATPSAVLPALPRPSLAPSAAPSLPRAPAPVAVRSGSNGAARPPPTGPLRVGTVTVRANTQCTISIDGQVRGQTPLQRAIVVVGEHRVICRTPTGALRSRNVSVNAGGDTLVEFDR